MTLGEYVAEKLDQETAFKIFDYLEKNNCDFRITRRRKSKLGDFRVQGNKRSISVNDEPNRYRFIITLIHEIAHLKTFIEYKNRVMPHGKEWKNNFRVLLHDFGIRHFFQNEEKLVQIFDIVFDNPTATAGIDLELEKCYQKYDAQHSEDECFLSDLPIDAFFIYRQQLYQKKKVMRTRALCKQIVNNRMYGISLSSMVIPISEEDVKEFDIHIDKAENTEYLGNLQPDTIFELNSLAYRVKEHRKTRTLCQCIQSKRLYTIPMHMEVEIINK